MLLLQLMAGILLGTVSALVIGFSGMEFGLVLLSYSLGGATGFLFSGLYLRMQIQAKVQQQTDINAVQASAALPIETNT